jgi:hypothetical protein
LPIGGFLNACQGGKKTNLYFSGLTITHEVDSDFRHLPVKKRLVNESLSCLHDKAWGKFEFVKKKKSKNKHPIGCPVNFAMRL